MVKKTAVKTIKASGVFSDPQWTVNFGELKAGSGPDEEFPRLFEALGEKLPFEALPKVQKYLKGQGITQEGVYIAHDSMSYSRYIGRGNIFQRLRACENAHVLELKYFSFYVVKDKKHEREIETLLIRAAGPMLLFNTKKKRLTISAGSISDYEAGTLFFERKYNKGK
jgi:hypothetical protein